MYIAVFDVVLQPRQRPLMLLTPVQTVYFVTSHYVCLANKATVKRNGPLTEGEIARATKELDHRCESGPAHTGPSTAAWHRAHETESLARATTSWCATSSISITRCSRTWPAASYAWIARWR